MVKGKERLVTASKTVAIISHVKKKEAHSLAEELIDWLYKRRVRVKIPLVDSKLLEAPELGVPPKDFPSDLDLLISLGGDGTLLRAAKILGGKETPILGVNLGKFGFLSPIEVADLYPVLTQVLEGKFKVQKRMMLDCEVFKEGKRIVKETGLNEAVVTRGTDPRLLELEVKLNNEHFYNYASDGLILATPTGSTAYSLSAGGPIVSPDVRVMLMTPICPHSLFDRTIILSKNDTVQVYPRFEQDVVVSVDGIAVDTPKIFDFVQVSVSAVSVSLVQPGKESFYALLKKKLKI